jgi:hypothetical protein
MDNAFKKMMDDEMKRAASKVALEDIRSNIETIANASEGVALLLKSFYDGFIKAGFDPMQAMYLTAQTGNTILTVSMVAPPPKQP